MSDEQFNCLSTKLSSPEPVKISLSMKNKNDSKVYIYIDCYNLHKIYFNMVHILYYNK